MALGFQLPDVLNRPDPMMTWRWVVAGGGALPFGLPAVYVESIDVPFENVQVQQGIFSGGTFTYFPANHDVAAFSMTFYEDEQATVLKWITQWRSKIKDMSTGLMNLPKLYKRDINVDLLNGRGESVFTVKLLGCWPSDTGNLGLSYSDEGRLTITQSFSIDTQTQ